MVGPSNRIVHFRFFLSKASQCNKCKLHVRRSSRLQSAVENYVSSILVYCKSDDMPHSRTNNYVHTCIIYICVCQVKSSQYHFIANTNRYTKDILTRKLWSL